MKKIIFSALYGLLLFTVACSNEEILIEKDNNVNDVNVTVNLSNFISNYNFRDTQHDISVSESYRTFNSENGLLIHVRTLFYDSQGVLVDSLVTYASTTNQVSRNIKLAEGRYTVITTLNFAEKENYKNSWWWLCEKEKLSTVYLAPRNMQSLWSIMSYASQSVRVETDEVTNVSITPSPIGALCYMYCQNFQYENEANSERKDNGVREIALYSQNVANGYRLNPNASEKYIYRKATETGSWYYLKSFEPSDFSESNKYGYFRTNLYSYTYILAPNFNFTFGYSLKNENYFHGYGEQNVALVNGKTYLAYWDWFNVGNPYFGIADNNHWNSYSKHTYKTGKYAPVEKSVEMQLFPNK